MHSNRGPTRLVRNTRLTKSKPRFNNLRIPDTNSQLPLWIYKIRYRRKIMSTDKPTAGHRHLTKPLQDTIQGLLNNPYPHVSNPEGCKKRASVALILRFRPDYTHWSESSPAVLADEIYADVSASEPWSLEQFFAQPWVQRGDPEVLFIKRAARVGDRWTSHVALPGGKRDPEDEDDKAVAVRETVEEIGLDLTSPDAYFIGNLPERVISTSWGKVPCVIIFVFLPDSSLMVFIVLWSYALSYFCGRNRRCHL